MEFSRVSPKRKLGLVVVMDPEHGDDCPTHAIASIKTDIHAVAEDLRDRERMKDIDKIGAVCLQTGFERAGHPYLADRVRLWCQGHGVLGAVWTDLGPNFEDSSGTAFSIGAAMAYLRKLTGDNLAEAVRYIDHAPAQTDTPLRRALAADHWWTSLPRTLQPDG